MTTQMKRMDVISNNLANVDTTGFKKDAVISGSFPEQLTKRLQDQQNGFIPKPTIGKMSLGVYVDKVHTNFMQGSMKRTDGILDVGIQGKGFIAIQTVDKDGQSVEKYTRDGSLTLGPDGTLMTKEGNRVVGQSGGITLPKGDLRIDAEGSIFIDDQYFDRIKVVEFENPETLRKYGDNLLKATPETKEVVFSGQLMQGFLESANVNTVQEMVDMITIMRTYEANQKMIQSHDQTLGKAVNEVGKV